VLCIRRTLTEGRLAGFVCGLGAATADGFYGAVAGFGLTIISGFLLDQHVWLHLVGGVFLCYLGARTFVTPPAKDTASTRGGGELGSAFLSTLLLTLTNPLTILSFAAIFAGLGLSGSHRGLLAAGLLVLGVFLGSVSWWLILSSGVSLLRARVAPTWMRWVNRLSGIVIATFGVLALVSVR
jgi:threonine/homoserine/homoserine lactone efflux protein